MVKFMRKSEDGYTLLAHAIVFEATESYRYALLALKENTSSVKFRIRKARLEEFFRSEWYTVLTDVDGEYLINHIKKECGYDW